MEEVQPSLSTSADTIRNLPTLEIPVRPTSHRRSHSHSHSRSHSRSRSRPRGSAHPHTHPDSPSSSHDSWPSPSSPSGESVSSLPSVGSSFMFSSLPASPPHHFGRQEHEFGSNDFGGGDRSLIIPSLMLPSALRPPTTYGRTLGRLRLLMLGSSCAASVEVAEEAVLLLTDQDIPELVHVGPWDEFVLEDGEEVVGKIVRMSTDWIEHRDVTHGEDRYEPCDNIELVKLDDYNSLDYPDVTLNTVFSIIRARFRAISAANDTHTTNEFSAASTSTSTPPSLTTPSSPLLETLLNSPQQGDDLLYTAVIIIPSPIPTPSDAYLIDTLRTHVPVIVLSPSHASPHSTMLQPGNDLPRLPTEWRSMTPPELRTTLYQDHDAVTALRREAAELFLNSEGATPASLRLHDRTVDVPSQSSDLHPLPNPTPDAHELTSESGESLEGTWKARASGRRSDRSEGFKARRNSATKATSRGFGGVGTVRGRPRGNTMERRRTITAATHSRPVVGPLARLDSLVSGQTSSQPPVLPPATQSRRRRYAAEHGLSTGSTTGHAPFIPPSSFSTFDPLHIPSLVRLAIEGLLLGPLRLRLSRLFGKGATTATYDAGNLDAEKVDQGQEQPYDLGTKTRSGSLSFVPIALIAGAFCAGMGVGVVLARSRL